MRVNKKRNNIKPIIITAWPIRIARNYIHEYSAEIKTQPSAINYCQGGGIALTAEEAKSKAIYEVVERYCGSTMVQKTVNYPIKKVANNLNYIHPKLLIQFNNSQYTDDFPYSKINNNSMLEWVQGYSHSDRKNKLIPAFSVYLGYNLISSLPQKYFPSSSCGLATYSSFDEAVVRGIFELFERDSAMRVWLSRKGVARIDIETIKNSKIQYIIQKIKAEDLLVDICFEANSLRIPTIIVLIHASDRKIPFVSFGLSSGIKLEEAILKALLEAIMVRNTLDYLHKSRKLKKYSDYTEIKEFVDHIMYYAYPSTSSKWKFLISGEMIGYDEVNKFYINGLAHLNNLDSLVGHLKKNGLETISIDLSNDVSKKFGLHVVRVIIPGLMQMDYDYNFRFLGHKNCSINQNPHPFS